MKTKEKVDLKGTKLEPKGKLKPVKNAVKKISIHKLQRAEFARQHLRILPSPDHTLEDTLKPEYWAHVTNKVVVSDRIEALWEDSSKFVEYIVLDVGSQWVKVAKISEVDLSKTDKAPAPEQESEYEIKWADISTKYTIIRLSDGQRMSDGHKTKDSANAWLAEHKKSL